MKNLRKWLEKGNEQGQGMIEYALILSFIALAVVTVVTTLGTSLLDLFSRIADLLEAVQ